MSNNIQVNIKEEDLIFLPLGGAGEIGMNCNLYHYLDHWLMIDLGVTFNDERVLSADLIMPDINFITDYKRKSLICIRITYTNYKLHTNNAHKLQITYE